MLLLRQHRQSGLDAIYARIKFGGSNAIIEIPYCRRCQLHYRSAAQRALGTLARVPAIGFTILAVMLSLGMLMDVLVGFLLQLLVVVVAMVLAGRTYVSRSRRDTEWIHCCVLSR